MEQLSFAGTDEDWKSRPLNARKDSEDLQTKIVRARRRIFQEGRPIKSKHVEALLKPQSLVPNMVSIHQYI
jgi:hypothetical protein